MKKAEEYRRRAEDCRKLAASATTEKARQELWEWPKRGRNWRDFASRKIASRSQIRKLPSVDGLPVGALFALPLLRFSIRCR